MFSFLIATFVMSDFCLLVCSTKIDEISDISKCFEDFVSQALGVLTRIYAAELREDIKNMISLRFGIIPEHINKVYGPLMTKLRDDSIDNIESGRPVIYNGSVFRDRYHAILEIGRKKLNFRFDYSLDSLSGDFRDFLFIKQLISIDDTKNEDLDRIADLTKNWLFFNNNLQEHWNNNDIIHEDVKRLTEDVYAKWRTYYHSNHRRIISEATCSELCEAGCNTVDSMRQCEFLLADTPLGNFLSEGCI